MQSSADATTRQPSFSVVGGSARRVTTGAALLVLAVLLGLAETWLLAWSPLPWLRLGLGNIAVVVALAWMGPRTALTVTTLRVVLVGLATGTLLGPGFVLALSGALCALAAMVLLRSRGERFSVVGWSMAGAAAHVVGQFVAAALISGSSALLALAPVSVIAGTFLGLATGLIARLLISRVVTPVG